MIVAGLGRFGPYVKHGKTYASLEEGDEVLSVGLNRAVTLIAEKKANPGKGRRFGADPGKTLGEHPDKGGPIVAKKGRYGPYVSHDGINATLPGDKTPETVTLDEAVSLLDARAEQVGKRGGKKAEAKQRPRRPPARPRTEKKTKKTAKKPTATAKPRPKAPKRQGSTEAAPRRRPQDAQARARASNGQSAGKKTAAAAKKPARKTTAAE